MLQDILRVFLVKQSYFSSSEQWVTLFLAKIFIDLLHVVHTGAKCIPQIDFNQD
jgi:hypothetical protein